MRFSVVINTYNRAESLKTTLAALHAQTHSDFEVVVVNGPSDDGTAELLGEYEGRLRVVDCPERVLGVSRNLGIDAAAGEIVAFVDDDGIPEPRWLEDLDAAYADPAIGGAGGLTLDPTGTQPQYRYSVCDRLGVTNFDREPPLDAYNEPGAEPFLYLQGTNSSFRRSVLEAVDGFDEHFDYIFDESELASRIIDAGHPLAALPGAVVHHKFLPSHLRARIGTEVNVTDPFVPIKNRAYFALKVGRSHHGLAQIFESLTYYLDGVRAWATDMGRRGRFSPQQHRFWLRRAEEGFERGVEIGLNGEPRTRSIAAADPSAFLPFPTRVADGRRLCVALATLDYPPRPAGGIARFTRDLAIGLAEAGHEAHVVTRDDEHGYRMDFEDGVWVHRFPVRGRAVPGVDGHPLEGNLDHVASVRNAVERVAERAPVDLVAGSLWIGEPLLCALDPRWPTAVACNTPIAKVAELQPHTAAAGVTPWQEKLEAALLNSGAFLQPVSHENARLCEAIAPGRPMEVIWHGVRDRRGEVTRTREDDAVEILFVGRLEPRKGIDTLLEAAAELLPSRPNVRIRVVGADNPHANGRPGAFSSPGDQVVFAGELGDEELLQAYADADVFCGPSRYESFGLVHVEAMMMGLPVVACAAGGMTETVVDGETGRLVAPGDAGALAELCDDASLRERWGAAGRARYDAEFRNEIAVERNVAAWTRLVQEHVPEGDVAENVAALLRDVCELDEVTAQAGAAALLDPTRFPVDHEDGVRALLGASDEDFVTGVYRVLLDRDPEASGHQFNVERLRGGKARVELVAEMARSPETAAAGVDPRFVRRLPRIDAATAERAVRQAWLEDDYAVRLVGVLAGPRADPAIGAGLGRRELLECLVAMPSVRSRLFEPDALLALDLPTRESLAEGLEALGGTGDEEFVDGLYRVLLGRESDPGGSIGHRQALLEGTPRRTVTREIAMSDEAAARGITDELALELAEHVAEPPPPAPRGLARRVADRLST